MEWDIYRLTDIDRQIYISTQSLYYELHFFFFSSLVYWDSYILCNIFSTRSIFRVLHSSPYFGFRIFLIQSLQMIIWIRLPLRKYLLRSEQRKIIRALFQFIIQNIHIDISSFCYLFWLIVSFYFFTDSFAAISKKSQDSLSSSVFFQGEPLLGSHLMIQRQCCIRKSGRYLYISHIHSISSSCFLISHTIHLVE